MSSDFLCLKKTGPNGSNCCASIVPSLTNSMAAASVPATPVLADLPSANSGGKNVSNLVHSGICPMSL